MEWSTLPSNATTCRCRNCSREVYRALKAEYFESISALNELLAGLSWSDVEQVTPVNHGDMKFLVVYNFEVYVEPKNQEVVKMFSKSPEQPEPKPPFEGSGETPLGEEIDGGGDAVQDSLF